MYYEYEDKCQDCGECKPDVHSAYCPYSYEVNNEEKQIIICDDCFSARKEDI